MVDFLKVFMYKNNLFLYSTYRVGDKEKLARDLCISEDEIDERVSVYENDVSVRNYKHSRSII